MLNRKREDRLDRLTDELRRGSVLGPRLIANVVADACIRLPVLSAAGKAGRIDQLINAGAWSDLAFALIELELPAWKLRRLVCEDGEWLCSLSKQPNMPAVLDETVDANHEVLSLAILGAFVEACRRSGSRGGAGSPRVRQPQLSSGDAACCDNFA